MQFGGASFGQPHSHAGYGFVQPEYGYGSGGNYQAGESSGEEGSDSGSDSDGDGMPTPKVASVEKAYVFEDNGDTSAGQEDITDID